MYNHALGMSFEQFLETHEGFMYKMHRKYINSGDVYGWTSDDILQHCMIGMYTAYKKFDPSLGWSVTTIIGNCIRFEIARYLNRDNRNGIKLSRITKEFYYKEIHNKINELTREEIIEVCRKNGLTKFMVDQLLAISELSVSSLDFAIPNDANQETSLYDVIRVEETTIEEMAIQNTVLEKFLGSISDRDRMIVLCSMEGETQSQIAEKVGVTQVQVSRILKKLRNKLKGLLEVEV